MFFNFTSLEENEAMLADGIIPVFPADKASVTEALNNVLAITEAEQHDVASIEAIYQLVKVARQLGATAILIALPPYLVKPVSRCLTKQGIRLYYPSELIIRHTDIEYNSYC